jgi:ABC-2 type transport system ATP-binding protein
VIEVNSVSKRYGEKVAVDNLTFTAKPGVITGFLGPNGAGKSTTMRVILGLDSASSGSCTVNGKSYHDMRAPLHEVGALLEAKAIHTGRTGYNHLLALSQTHGIPKSRVEEVIDLVGLKGVAKKRVGGFSLGMGQRLGVASALLGDPQTVILDEPANGLDPEGIRWMRDLLKSLANEGRTVFLSSHLMSEMQQTADDLVVIGKGKLIAQTSVAEFVTGASTGAPVKVRSADQTRLSEALKAEQALITQSDDDFFEVSGIKAERIGEIALDARVVLYELTPLRVSLEDAYMSLTKDAVEYRQSGAGAPDWDAIESESESTESTGAAS